VVHVRLQGQALTATRTALERAREAVLGAVEWLVMAAVVVLILLALDYLARHDIGTPCTHGQVRADQCDSP
jgi:hypothetical protein